MASYVDHFAITLLSISLQILKGNFLIVFNKSFDFLLNQMIQRLEENIDKF